MAGEKCISYYGLTTLSGVPFLSLSQNYTGKVIFFIYLDNTTSTKYMKYFDIFFLTNFYI